MSDQEVDQGKRGFLLVATGVVGGVAAVATAVPFAGSMFPSERAKAAGAPVEVDISKLAPGEMQIVEYRGFIGGFAAGLVDILDPQQKPVAPFCGGDRRKGMAKVQRAGR